MIGKPRFMVRRVLNGQTRDTIRVSISLLETPDLGGSWKYIVRLTAVCGERGVPSAAARFGPRHLVSGGAGRSTSHKLLTALEMDTDGVSSAGKNVVPLLDY